MGLIQADIEGLSALAALSETQAGALAGSATLPTRSFLKTPSTAAVADAHAVVGVVAGRLAQRMQSNAAKFSTAATGFADTETASASTLQQVD